MLVRDPASSDVFDQDSLSWQTLGFTLINYLPLLWEVFSCKAVYGPFFPYKILFPLYEWHLLLYCL